MKRVQRTFIPFFCVCVYLLSACLPTFAVDYSGWATTHSVSTPSGDPDADGIENLLEYVFCTDPNLKNSSPVVLGDRGNGFELYLERRKNMTDVTFEVLDRVALDSGDWSSSSGVLGAEVVTSIDADKEGVVQSVNVGAQDHYFIQLKASVVFAGNTNSVVQNLAVASADNSVLLSWDVVAGATGYNIYWSDQPNVSAASESFTVSKPPYSVTGLTAGPWYFKVEPIFGGMANGNLSSQITGIPAEVELERPDTVFPPPKAERPPYQRDFSDPMNPKIDWPAFLARHDLRWGTADATMSFPEETFDCDLLGPENYDVTTSDKFKYNTELYKAGWIGNGLIGATVYKEFGSPWILKWDLGRQDVTAELNSTVGYRALIGSIDLNVNSTVTDATMRYDIWNAELRGTITTMDGDINFRTFAERTNDVIVIETTTTGSPSYNFTVSELPPYSSAQIFARKDPARSVPANQDPPSPTRSTQGDITVVTSPLSELARGANALAFKEELKADGKVFYLSIGKSWQPNESDQSVINNAAVTEAVHNVTDATNAGFSSLETMHRNWWHAYLAQSYVDFPMEPRLEQYYWLNINRFGSTTRGDSDVIVDNNGPWMAISEWACTTWNMNVQTVYLPSFTPNRMDVGYSLVNVYKRWSSNNWWQSLSYPDAFTQDRNYTYRSEPQSHDTRELGNLTWALYSYYRYWKYSADDSLATGADSVFELLKKNCKFYQHVMGGLDANGNWIDGVQGPDGKWHLPEMRSPEYSIPSGPDQYKNEFIDTNYSLQLYDWLLGALIEMNAEFNLNDPEAATWASIKANLTDFPVGTDGALEIARGVDHADAERHNSHVIGLYPLMNINPDQGAAAEELYRKSVADWVERFPITADYRAFSWVYAICMYATLGEGDKAYNAILNFFDERAIVANGTYIEDPWPVQECPLALTECAAYMLLQSWGDCVRVFPAVPSHWEAMTFTDLRTEGAFLVSAERDNYSTQWIRIKSLAGKPFVLETDMDTFDVISSLGRQNVSVTSTTGPRGQDRWMIDIQKDETILLKNIGPDARLVAPDTKGDFYTSDTITFEGTGTDRQGGALTGASLEWSSNLDGVLGTGASYSMSGLSAGEHIIRFTATDGQGNSSSETVKITVKAGNRPSLTDDLVVWYKFDETTGTSVVDSSGNGHDATCSATPNWVTGRTGGAIEFDQKRVDMNNATNVFAALSDEVTISFWTLDDGIGGTSATRYVWQGKAGSSDAYACILPENSTTFLATFKSGGDKKTFVTTLAELEHRWIHWVYTRNTVTGASTIYKNGVVYQSFQDPSGVLDGVTEFTMGATVPDANGDHWRHYSGIMDDFRIYSREFLAGDVQLLLESSFAGNQAPNDVVLDVNVSSVGALPGVLVGTLTGSDPDVGETLSYSLSDDAGGMFAVSGDQLVVGATPPTIGNKTITVVVTDLGGLTYAKNLTIVVAQNDAPTDVSLSATSVPSTFGVGTPVATVSATDPNAGDLVTFELTDDASGSFSLSGDQLSVAGALSPGSYSITVKATDNGGLSYTKNLTVQAVTPAAYSLDPSTISGCSLWLDGADPDGNGIQAGWGETNVTAGVLATWSDKSGNNNHASQIDGDKRPKIKVTGDAKNLSTVEYDGLDDSLSFGLLSDIRTVFWVLRDDDPDAANTYRFVLGDTATWDFHREKTTLWRYSASGLVRNGDTRLNKVDFDGESNDLPHAQRVVLSVRTTGDVSASKLAGDRNISGRDWLGEFSELIIYNRALTDTERDQVENYLYDKWIVTP